MKKFITLILTVAVALTVLASCNTNPYSKLEIIDIGEETEYFGIAFREGSDMTRKVEDITVQLISEGLFDTLSTKYEVGAVDADEYVPAADACTDSGDWDYIRSKGTLKIGITDYAPMDYKENGEWVGFDAEYAKAVCEKLGVTPVFVEINWGNKLLELNSKAIDCVWNGMTITNEIEASADCTIPYMYNKQVAVVKKANASLYTAGSLASFAGKTIAAEDGSAGASVVAANAAVADGLKPVSGQTDALLEVLSGASDAAVVDLLLAKALINKK